MWEGAHCSGGREQWDSGVQPRLSELGLHNAVQGQGGGLPWPPLSLVED